MDIATLKAENKELKAQNAMLKSRLEQLEKLFSGRKSERFIPSQAVANQPTLFEVQKDGDIKKEEQDQEKEKITYERRKRQAKKHPGRTAIPDHFPVEEEVIEPEENTEGLVKIGEQVTEWVDYTPASLVRKRIIRPKYAKPKTEDKEKDTEVLIAELPSRPIPKCIASACLLAYIIVSKFVDHLPFYRQSQRFKRDYNWKLHKSTLNSWYATVCTLLEPLYKELVEQTFTADYLQADESRIKVLTKILKDKKGKSIIPDRIKGSKQMLGWMWVVHDPLTGNVVFNYESSRCKKAAMRTLERFTGRYLQTDAYASYNEVVKEKNINRQGCLAHVRRKFFDAKNNDAERAEFALELIQTVYKHERKVEQWPPKRRKKYRKKNIKPLYKKLKKWADKEIYLVPPKSPIGKALAYLLNEWSTLMVLFYDGKLLIDNNAIENKIRPLALGRKNYLFAGSHPAAQRAAMMYSFFATCKAQGVNPYEWLSHTLSHIADTKMTDLHTLLPGNYSKEQSKKAN
ncbi:MAG: IS66 family transposase [Bacteroidetes bacterium]|jgi:transposase|nr:IS66 family transposase [Bacteroidota bacterium]